MSDPTFGNLSADIPGDLPEELTEVIASGKNVRVERIVSRGHCSPEGFWYDQDENEWVLVVAGAAKLQFHGEDERIKLQPGDHVLIPAHVKHRVEWTALDMETIWIAVFYS